MRVIFGMLMFTVLSSQANSDLIAASAEAFIKPTNEESALTGRARFEDSEEGLQISAQIENASPGEHGFHIHQYGSCSDNGKGAGDHYNPEQKPHGLVMKDGVQSVHAGDFGNIKVGEDGKGSVSLVVPGLAIEGNFAIAGRALIVHEKSDQFTQPLGDAGGRVGCGAIYIVKTS